MLTQTIAHQAQRKEAKPEGFSQQKDKTPNEAEKKETNLNSRVRSCIV